MSTHRVAFATHTKNNSTPARRGPRKSPGDLLLSAVKKWSPRPSCRVDYFGNHLYSDAPLPKRADGHPWALYLADTAAKFHLLAFDLDDHNGEGAAAITADLTGLTQLLDEAKIPYLVTASGGGSGRHIWARIAPTTAKKVATMARTARAQFPTLDIAPLTNPATGVVRAPGSAHRKSETIRSTILDLNGRTQAQAARQLNAANRKQTDTFFRLISRETDRRPASVTPLPAPRKAPQPTPQVDTSAPVFQSESLAARLALLPKWSQNLVNAQPSGDTSLVSWTVSKSCAYAGWTFAEYRHLALVEKAPGLEHLRTRNEGPWRPRSPRSNPEEAVRKEWERALEAVPYASRTSGNDAATAHRIRQIDAVAELADSPLAGFSGVTGLLSRHVLHVFLAACRTACTTELAYGSRRWAIEAGLPRQTVERVASHLEAAGWITRTKRNIGPLSTVWSLKPPSDTQIVATRGTRPRKGIKRPNKLSAKSRAAKLATARHDIWSHPGLGHTAHELWWLLGNGLSTAAEVTAHLGLDRRTVDTHLTVLAELQLIRAAGDNRWRAARIEAADRIDGPHLGTGRARARRYALESLQWAQMCAEIAHKSTPYSDRKGLSPQSKRLRRFAVIPDADGVPQVFYRWSMRRARGVSFAELQAVAAEWRTRFRAGDTQLSPAERRLVDQHRDLAA